jgi:preprotein translocase subunit SecG
MKIVIVITAIIAAVFIATIIIKNIIRIHKQRALEAKQRALEAKIGKAARDFWNEEAKKK